MPASSAPAVEARNLEVGYPADGGAVTVLADLNISVPAGAFLSILGPSGCGKSTLLRAVADLLEPLSGELRVLGGEPGAARGRRDVGFVFQDATLLPWLSARENVRLPLRVGRANLTRDLSDQSGRLLDLMGIGALVEHYPHQLSGGQRQRVAIARALMGEPKLLLMDEPFGALDEITRDRLNDELLALWRRTGATILFVTHSVMEAAYLGETLMVLAANPGRMLSVTDLRPLKSGGAPVAREDPALVAVMAKARGMLAEAA